MRKFSTLFMLVLVMSISFLFSQAKNPDKPLKGEWDFNLKQVWMVDKAGEELFARPHHLLVSEDGTSYLYDNKNFKYYLFSKDGKFVKSFGPKGEGPGEIKYFYNASLVKDKLIVVDNYEIEYFTRDGKYIKTAKHDFSRRPPNHFLSENEIVYFPFLRVESASFKIEEGKIFRYNLETKKETPLVEFPIFKGGFAAKEEIAVGVVIQGLSPLMVVGYDSDRFYYAINNTYVISAADYNGKKLNRFSLEREKKKVSKKEIFDFLKTNVQYPIPDDMLKEIARTLPTELTYFIRIQVHNKLVYVYKAYLDRQLERQQIDIFSPAGQYLYRAFIHAPEGFTIVSNPNPILAIKNDHLHVALESKGGEVLLAKFEITLPKQ